MQRAPHLYMEQVNIIKMTVVCKLTYRFYIMTKTPDEVLGATHTDFKTYMEK